MRRQGQVSIRVTFALVTVLAVCRLVGPGAVWADKKEKDEVHELMERTHEGKNSPWKKAQAAAAKDPVDFAALAATLPKLDAMSQALVNSKKKEVRESSDGYVAAVKALGAGAGKKDAAAARKALESLSKSCADCHFKGGPGGELDED